MRIVHGWKGLEASDRGAAVAYGNFDGVHRGHQKVIAQAAKAAQALKAPLGLECRAGVSKARGQAAVISAAEPWRAGS